MRLPWNDPILGLDPRCDFTNLFQALHVLMHRVQDSYDTEHSAMFDDDEWSGLGRWGDPNDDIQITTGGFRDIVRVYPSPHRIRRNYTLQPLVNIPNPFPNDPLAPPIDTSILINGSFTRANYDFLLNGFVGDFRGFQGYLEGPRVCVHLPPPSAPFDILTSTQGAHGGPHLIMGGDMTGFCPNGTGAPDCYAGPKWTPNDPMFFLHHAVRPAPPSSSLISAANPLSL